MNTFREPITLIEFPSKACLLSIIYGKVKSILHIYRKTRDGEQSNHASLSVNVYTKLYIMLGTISSVYYLQCILPSVHTLTFTH